MSEEIKKQRMHNPRPSVTGEEPFPKRCRQDTVTHDRPNRRPTARNTGLKSRCRKSRSVPPSRFGNRGSAETRMRDTSELRDWVREIRSHRQSFTSHPQYDRADCCEMRNTTRQQQNPDLRTHCDDCGRREPFGIYTCESCGNAWRVDPRSGERILYKPHSKATSAVFQSKRKTRKVFSLDRSNGIADSHVISSNASARAAPTQFGRDQRLIPSLNLLDISMHPVSVQKNAKDHNQKVYSRVPKQVSPVEVTIVSRRTELLLRATKATAHLEFEDQQDILRCIFGRRLSPTESTPIYRSEPEMVKEVEKLLGILAGVARRPKREQVEILRRDFLGPAR